MFSVAVTDIDASPELLLELNNINSHLRFARAFHLANQVLIESDIWADDLNPSNFRHSCHNIASATDYATPALAALGGSLYFDETKTEEYHENQTRMNFPGWSSS